MNRPYSGAFTLVELLVVITIIVVLLALLVPALDKAIEHALRVKCGANQRQFAMANQLYAQESRQQFVPIKQPTQGVSPASYYQAWYQNLHFAHLLGVHGSRLLPYQNPQTGQEIELTLIPSQLAELPPTPFWPAGLMCPSAPSHRLRGAILWNAQGFNWSEGDWNQAIVIRRNRVERPADKAQMTDSNDWHVIGHRPNPAESRADYRLYWDTRGDADWATGYNAIVAYRHTEGAMIAHFDGHVEYYAKERAWTVESPSVNTNLWDITP